MAANKHIVFDWNCTLLDDFHAIHHCTNLLLESEGCAPVSHDMFRENYAIPFETLYRNHGLNDAQIKKLYKLGHSVFHDHYEPMANEASLREGAVEILAEVRSHGIHSLILSNHIVDPIRAQLKRLGIDHHFAAVLAYADRATQGKHMTKGQKLEQFLQTHDPAPGNTIIIGDTIEEIHIARAQNLISVAITGGCAPEKKLREENPDYLIHSLHELKPIMQERGFA